MIAFVLTLVLKDQIDFPREARSGLKAHLPLRIQQLKKNIVHKGTQFNIEREQLKDI